MKSLHGVTGIDEFTINDDKDSIIVNTTLPFTTVQNTIEETHGVQAVLKGYTGTTGKCLSSDLRSFVKISSGLIGDFSS